MPTLTLSTRAVNDHQLKLFDDLLRSMLGGLKVEIEIGTSSRGWVQLTTSGEDEEVASRYLDQKIGTSSPHLEEVEKFAARRGYVMSFNKMKLAVDVGISSPSSIDAVIPLRQLQAQLVDGRKMAPKKIVDLFGLVENLPLSVKITDIDKEKGQVQAMLSERQLALYRRWTRSLLDRLMVLGASSDEVRRAVGRARSNRDVVKVEPLSVLEHAVVCKLGTDAVGLIPKIGKRLPNASFAVFEPERILDFLGDYQVL